jgi:hypothetical protein
MRQRRFSEWPHELVPFPLFDLVGAELVSLVPVGLGTEVGELGGLLLEGGHLLGGVVADEPGLPLLHII